MLRNHLADRLQKLRSPFTKAFRRLKISAYRKLFVNLRNAGRSTKRQGFRAIQSADRDS
jgi:hypothetical protein